MRISRRNFIKACSAGAALAPMRAHSDVMPFIHWLGGNTAEASLATTADVSLPPRRSEFDLSKAPLQSPGVWPDVQLGRFTVRRFARFDLDGRVLSTRRYFSDPEAEISPIDLALGWMKMAHRPLVDQVRVSQSDRWYWWSIDKNDPGLRRVIETQSANMHMVPARPSIREDVLAVRAGDLIRLRGYLVVITGENFEWISSRSRDDIGNGACEVVLLDHVQRTTDHIS